MTIPEITLDLVLRRPAGVPPDRWTEVLTAACCQRLVPHLRSFSIDAERGRLSIGLPEGEPTEGLALDVDAVAAMVAQLAGPR